MVRDSSGKILYFIEKIGNMTKVIDAGGKVLGWCENGKTFKADGTVISYSENPGLLYR